MSTCSEIWAQRSITELNVTTFTIQVWNLKCSLHWIYDIQITGSDYNKYWHLSEQKWFVKWVLIGRFCFCFMSWWLSIEYTVKGILKTGCKTIQMCHFFIARILLTCYRVALQFKSFAAFESFYGGYWLYKSLYFSPKQVQHPFTLSIFNLRVADSKPF